MFTSIWFNKELNLRLRRLFFVALVYNSLISALEAFVLSDSEHDRLTKFLVSRSRALLMGKAHTYDADEDKHQAWTNAEVLKRCGLLPTHLELQLRRLKWLQALARKPEQGGALLAAWFGQADWDKKDTNNPWVQQFIQDIQVLHQCEFQHIDEIVEQPTILFTKISVRQAFLELDITELRAIWKHNLNKAYSSTTNANDTPTGLFPCDIVHEGKACQYIANTRAKLVHHQVMSKQPGHDMRNMLNFLVVTNQCCFCSTVFSDIATTQHHVASAFKNRTCKADRSYKKSRPDTPSHLMCPWSNIQDEHGCGLCTFEAQHLAQLHLHIVGHLDWAPSLVFDTYDCECAPRNTASTHVKVRQSNRLCTDLVAPPTETLASIHYGGLAECERPGTSRNPSSPSASSWIYAEGSPSKRTQPYATLNPDRPDQSTNAGLIMEDFHHTRRTTRRCNSNDQSPRRQDQRNIRTQTWPSPRSELSSLHLQVDQYGRCESDRNHRPEPREPPQSPPCDLRSQRSRPRVDLDRPISRTTYQGRPGHTQLSALQHARTDPPPRSRSMPSYSTQTHRKRSPPRRPPSQRRRAKTPGQHRRVKSPVRNQEVNWLNTSAAVAAYRLRGLCMPAAPLGAHTMPLVCAQDVADAFGNSARVQYPAKAKKKPKARARQP